MMVLGSISGVLGCDDMAATRNCTEDEADDEEPDDGSRFGTRCLGVVNMVERSVL